VAAARVVVEQQARPPGDLSIDARPPDVSPLRLARSAHEVDEELRATSPLFPDRRGSKMTPDPLLRAAELLADPTRPLLVCSGAGASVSSGLGTFRGPGGYWSDERIFRLAVPEAFDREDTAREAWGWYGGRLLSARAARRRPPSDFYRALAEVAVGRRAAFAFTTNSDGLISRAGFARASYPACGDIHTLQCSRPCRSLTWDAPDDIRVEGRLLAGDLPLCPRCGAIARPFILLFGDGRFVFDAEYCGGVSEPMRLRSKAARRWSESEGVVVLEVGAGSTLPIARRYAERAAAKGWLVRVNPDEADAAVEREPDVSLRMTADEALVGIVEALAVRGAVW